MCLEKKSLLKVIVSRYIKQTAQHKKASNHHASARAIIKVSGHQHQWFPGVSQVVTM